MLKMKRLSTDLKKELGRLRKLRVGSHFQMSFSRRTLGPTTMKNWSHTGYCNTPYDYQLIKEIVWGYLPNEDERYLKLCICRLLDKKPWIPVGGTFKRHETLLTLSADNKQSSTYIVSWHKSTNILEPLYYKRKPL